MPIYEFICDKCGEDFEELVFRKDEAPVCPHCGSSSTHKLISAPVRSHRGSSVGEYAAPKASSGCGGCSGGNCASCGR